MVWAAGARRALGGLCCLAALSGYLVEASPAKGEWCGSRITGHGCKEIVVDGCTDSFDEGVQKFWVDDFKVNAVHYVPRPVGVDSQKEDIYSEDFTQFHRRDLHIIKHVLKANTIRLAPWPVDDMNAHDMFFRLCREVGLFIIPTFDLSHFITDPDELDRSWDNRMSDMEKKFADFMQHFGPTAPVLMWSINHGLYLNETAANGNHSRSLSNNKRNEYFLFLNSIRRSHHYHEWNSTKQRYNRPLALPLLLDTYNIIDEIQWYMYLAETYWDHWSKPKMGADSEPPPQFGSFDVWLAEAAALPKEQLMSAMRFIHKRSGEACETEVNEKCGYTSRKAVVLQFGVSSLYAGVYLSSRVVNSTVQQQYLGEVWDVLNSPEKNGMHCVRGGVIDEWADDWDRCGALGYPTSGYMHTTRGECSQIKLSVGSTHIEWFGLNGQYSFMFFHCIDPRYLGKGGFRFLPVDEAEDKQGWKDVAGKGIGLCSMKVPPLSNFARWFVVMGLFLVLVLWRMRHLLSSESSGLDARSQEQQTQRDGGEMAPPPPAPGVDGVVNRRNTMHGAKGTKELQVPEFLGSQDSFKFVLQVDRDLVLGSKAGKMTREEANFIISAHAEAQARRLQHQTESEAFAVQDKSRQDNPELQVGKLSECYDQAMRNVHSRALEGYVAWLEHQAQTCEEKKNELKEYLDNSERLPSKLWIEALLLRTIESLAEQLLHAPELVHALYDMALRGRKKKTDGSQDWGPDDDELKGAYIIDYRLLHSGIEKLKENPNPYEGGINFDDLNDCGRLNDPEELRKTYQESTGLFVIIDILSNFLPVIMVKMWLFLLAWYCYLILKSARTTDSRNGSFFAPSFTAGNTIQIFAFTDACIGTAIEAAILVQGVSQGRRVWLNNRIWLLRHGVSLAVTTLGAALLYASMDLVPLDRDWKPTDVKPPKPEALRACGCYWSVRVLSFLLLHQRLRQSSFIPGKPSKRKNPKVSGVATGDSEQGGGGAGAAGPQRDNDRTLPPKVKEFQPVSHDWRHYLFRFLVWLTMLGVCFVGEVFFIAPLAADFDSQEFCEIECMEKTAMHGAAPGPPTFLPSLFSVGNDCWACRGTLVMTWSLVFLTGFFDIYYVFFAGTAVVGYAMGEMRGLRNVLATALRYLDFATSGTGSKATSRTNWMEEALTDGELMFRVFGTSWRIVWSRLVESLYEECLINPTTRDDLVKAAGTMPWSSREETANFKPSDTFTELKFISKASRGSNKADGADVGHERTKCISGLRYRTERCGDAITLNVPKEDFVTQRVSLNRKGDRDKILAALSEDDPNNPDRSVLEVVKDVDVVDGTTHKPVPIPGNEGKEKKWRIVGDPDPQQRSSKLKAGQTEDELLKAFKELENLESHPVSVVFRTDKKYNECILKLDKPCCLHSVSLITTQDDATMDPVQWRVEGCQEGGQWKPIIWQDTSLELEPNSKRGAETDEWFEVESWRKDVGGSNSVDLNGLDSVVAERLGFFTASLRGLMDSAEYPMRHGVDSLLDSHIGNVPSLSQIIPVYGETIILDEKNLRQTDGVNTNLGFLISQFDNEWELLAKHLGKDPAGLYHSFVSGSLPRERADSEVRQKPDPIMEVRLWASMRAQTVARTIVGAIRYHEVLSLVPGIMPSDSFEDAEDCKRKSREQLEKCTELILAHQTYGRKRKDKKKGPQDSDQDVQYLMRKYSDKPFYLVIDYNEPDMEDGLRKKVRGFVEKRYDGFKGRLQFASVLLRARQQTTGSQLPDEDCLEIVSVLPRRYPLLVGKGDFRTQGKAGNQLGALRFARGHYLQMMDSNMGAFLGEACKVPFVLRRFCPYNYNRASVTARIIGFREFIFTERHGTVGNIMASSEFSFGTICQRFLAGLGARMHYGHPDFLDGFWASNRGSLSKASPAINLSEDIFAGFNVAMRGERSDHVDTLAWEKGREASFNSSSLFFSKISGGNAGVMRSRDLKIISEGLSIVDNFSFFFASIGFYLNNLLIDKSVMLYVLLFVLLSFSSKTLEEVGDRFSLLASEWAASMGIVAMFPRLMELILEYGILEGMLRFGPSVPGCMAMFTFINKSIASAVQETMITGKAKYIGTGRPNANTHYDWRECYFIYVKSHYYPALNVCYSYTLYFLLAQRLHFDSLPMFMVMISVLMWLIAPVLFCPQPTVKTLCKDLSTFWQFCIANPQWSVRKMLPADKTTEEMLHTELSDKHSTLYELWLLEELKSKQTSILLRVLFILSNCVKVAVMMAVVHASMLDEMFHFVVVFSSQMLLFELWRFLYRPTALMMIIMVAGLAVPLWWIRMPLVDFMIVLAAFNFGIRALMDFLLLLATLYLRPNDGWKDLPTTTEGERSERRKQQMRTRRYDILVEYFFVNTQQHLQHMYYAVFILLLNLAAQLPLVVLDAVGGLHSGLLLNFNLTGAFGCRRPGFEPCASGEEASSQAKPGRTRVSIAGTFLEGLQQRLQRRGVAAGAVPSAGGNIEMQEASSAAARGQALLGPA